ncbi:MAG: hypothetical protein PHX04_02335 [Bacilli bacterium]|nr:hypothetical protein [Bacilli bacterium]
MKNFWQFLIPIVIICGIGVVMLLNNTSYDDTKRLYVKCNSISKNFEVFSGTKLYFAEKNEECKLDIEVINVDRDFIKINTPYLWKVNESGETDKTEARETNIISADTEVTLVSYDEKTKYVFVFK